MLFSISLFILLVLGACRSLANYATFRAIVEVFPDVQTLHTQEPKSSQTRIQSNITNFACSIDDSSYLCGHIHGRVDMRNVAIRANPRSIVYIATGDQSAHQRTLPAIKSTRYRKNSYTQMPLVASATLQCRAQYDGTLYIFGSNTVHNHFHAVHDNLLPFYALIALDSIVDPTSLLKRRAMLVLDTQETLRSPILELLDLSFDDRFNIEKASDICFRRILWNSGPRLFYHHMFTKLRRVSTDLLRAAADSFWNLTMANPFLQAPVPTHGPSLSFSAEDPLKIVIFSRGFSPSGRSLPKEEMLVTFLRERGAHVILFHNYSKSNIQVQVALAFHANMIIGVHGAALVNGVFMNHGGYLMEMKTSYGFALDLFALVADSRYNLLNSTILHIY